MNEDEFWEELFHEPLKIFRIYNAGNYEHESLVLIAGEDCNLSDYVIFQTNYRVDNDLPDYAASHFLTFDDIEVKAGERVRIYTCEGEDREEIGKNTGIPYHVIYWNLDVPIWTNDDDEVKILRGELGYSKVFHPRLP